MASSSAAKSGNSAVVIPPLFLQDGVTDSFSQLLMENKCDNEVDYLTLAIHELMNEAGFRIQKNQPSSGKKLPKNWKNGDMYRFNYIYSDYSDVKCSVTALLTGKSLLVTGTLNLDDSDDAYHVKLKTCEYIDKEMLTTDNNQRIYQNLCKLSHKVKDNVILKMINEIKAKLGLIEEVLGLVTLPQELKLRLIFYLDVFSVCCLSRVNKDLHLLCADDEVWKRLVLCEFRSAFLNISVGKTYKDSFKDMHIQRKCEEEALRRERDMPHTPLRPDFNVGPDLIYTPGLGSNIPGIIGGFHDLYPGGFPRHPFGGPNTMNPPDLLLNRNRIQRPPGARFDPLVPYQDDDLDLDPLQSRRNHPDNLRRPGFGPDGGFGGGFGGFM